LQKSGLAFLSHSYESTETGGGGDGGVVGSRWAVRTENFMGMC